MRNLFSSLPRFTLFIILWAAAAVCLRSVTPWFYWGTLAVLPVFLLIRQEKTYILSTHGRRILVICAALLVVHIGWACVRVQNYDVPNIDTFWNDDQEYYIEAVAIAESWKQHIYPEIWQKGSPPYLGTLHTGYHRPLGALFLIFGPSTLAALLLNAFCAALFPLLAALIARYLWTDTSARQDTGRPAARYDTGMIAAILTALHPNQFYWASYMMKDTYVTFVFLLTMALLMGALRSKSIPVGIGAVLLIPYLFSLRIYAAFSLVAGVMLLPLLRLRGRTVAILVASALVAAALVCTYTFAGNQIFSQVLDSFYALAPKQAGNPTGIITQILAGIPALFLAPYAWLILEQPTPMYWLYPGMWYLYLVGYPLAFAGLAAAAKNNIRLAVIPITAFGLASMIFLVSAYSGNAPRQRYYLEYVVLLFAVYGLRYPSKWWIGGILAAELAFGIGQVLSLQ